MNQVARLENLAHLYVEMGNYAEAEPLYLEALEITRKTLGEDHPYFATALDNLGNLYDKMGNYAAAEPLYQQANEIAHKALLGEDNLSYATFLNNLANMHREKGNYAEAESLLRQVVEIKRRALGRDTPEVAITLHNLAWVYHEMGNYAAAEPLLRQTLEIRRRALGKDHPDYASTLNGLATLYVSMGNYAEAEPLLWQIVETTKALGEEHNPDFALSLNNLAGLYRKIGNYAEAEPLYQQALEIQRKTLGEHHPMFAQSLNNLAVLYEYMGNYAGAESLYQQALEIRRRALGKDHPDYASTLNGLATLYVLMGNYAAAEPLYKQALEIHRLAVGEDYPSYQTLNNLAFLYQEMGRYAEAEPLLRQVVEITKALGEDHPDFALSLNNLAGLYRERGQDTALMYHNLDLDNYAAAEPLYRTTESLLRQALEIRHKTLGKGHPDVAQSLNNLGELYREMSDYAEAEPLLRRALEIRRKTLGEEHPDVAQSLHNLAVLCTATRREAEALSLAKEAAAIDDRVIRQVFSIGSENQRMAYLKILQVNHDAFLSLVLQYLSHSSAAVQAALELVLRRKAIGAEALAAQRDAVLGGRYPDLEPRLRKLTTLRKQISEKFLQVRRSEDLDAHQQLLARWNAQQERLETELARQIPEMNLERHLRTADRQTVAEALPEGSTLIEFVRSESLDFEAVPARGKFQLMPPRYLAFVLLAKDPDNIEMIDLGEAEPIDRLIASFRASIPRGSYRHSGPHSPSPEGDEDGVSSLGPALREALFDPLLPALGGRRRLFVAPDGDLARLPFEVLPADDGSWLVDKYEISYLAVGRDVLRFGAASTGQPTDPLVAADPDFDLRGGTAGAWEAQTPGRRSRDLDRGAWHFDRLEGMRKEGEHIGQLLGVRPLLEGAVVEGRLKARQSPRILHLATHGFFLPDQERDPKAEHVRLAIAGGLEGGGLDRLAHVENPLLRSGLALAGVNTWHRGGSLPEEAEDGLLTAEDVTGMDLLGTELVALSACETGLGQVHAGEGVYGLRRAFVLAGAKTLVMSLWKVDDEVTRKLMEKFYRHLLKGESRVEALRGAQRAIKRVHPHPYYWGAFVCQGDPARLPIEVRRHG